MENNLDKLFRSKLEGQEPDFHPAAWDRMERLLDESGMTPAEKPKRSRRIFFILIFLGIMATGIAYVSDLSHSNIVEGSAMKESTKNTSVPVQKPTSNSKNTINEAKSLQKENTETPLKTESKDSNLTRSKEADQLSINDQKSTIASFSKPEFEKVIKQKPSSEGSGFIVAAPIQNRGDRKQDNSDGPNTRLANDGAETTLAPNDKKEAVKKSMLDDEPDTPISKEQGPATSSNHAELGPVTSPSRMALPLLNLLSTRTALTTRAENWVMPVVRVRDDSAIRIGIQAMVRRSNGRGYSVGPFVDYSLGGGFSLALAGQYDYQQFDAGPQLSVYDKIYSFGSELRERKFVLNSQKSVRVPITINKRFAGWSLFGGIAASKVFVSGGSTTTSGEITAAEYSNVENEFLRTINLSGQIGASISLNRYFDVDLGLEIRTKSLSGDGAVANNGMKYYPSLGLRYNLFKI